MEIAVFIFKARLLTLLTGDDVPEEANVQMAIPKTAESSRARDSTCGRKERHFDNARSTPNSDVDKQARVFPKDL